MKKNSIGKIIIRVLIGIVIALIAVAVIGYAVVKLYIVPKYAKKLAESGHQEIAEILEGNANLGSVPAIGSILADENVMGLIKDMDGNTARSLLDVMNALDEEEAAQEEATAGDDSGSSAQNAEEKPALEGKEAKNAEKPNNSDANKTVKDSIKENIPSSQNNRMDSAYDRIAAVASADEMADGLKIISKLDVSYVVSFASDGLTGAEKTEILRYIRTVLTPEEVSRTVQLYRKYCKYL